MSNISPETLFHFTGSFDNLVNILRNGFYPKFCLEQCKTIYDETFLLAYPMVCFCDIPLSQTKNHIDNYGCYGIGMTKNWAETKKLNPILYQKINSYLSDDIKTISTKFAEDSQRENMDDDEVGASLSMLDVLRYIKPYEGKLFKNNKSKDREIRFYDEREWRYLPNVQIHGTHHLSESEFNDMQKLENANRKMEEAKLDFEPDDIKYIILKERSEISGMIKSIREIKGTKYPINVVEELYSKIITCQQIKEDF